MKVVRQFARLFGAMLLLTTLAHAETLNVRLVLSDTTPPYQQFSETLNKALASADVNIMVSLAGEKLPPSRSKKIDLVIAAGMKATEFAITDFDAPLLSVMTPRYAYEMLSARRKQAMSAIYLEQSWERQLNFIHAALPKHNVVGMLYSPDAHIVLPRLPKGMSVNAQSVQSSDTFFSTLENILNNSDVLLVIPDSEIYSTNNMRNILLTSYRYKVPLIGISQAYVNAGALCAIFSTSEQFAEQAAKIVFLFVSDRQLPESQYSELYSIAVNQQVARSLGMVMDTPEEIRMRMKKTGEGKQ